MRGSGQFLKSSHVHSKDPLSDDKVAEFNELASAVAYNWHLEINNNEFATDEQIIKAIQSINDAEGE